MRRLKTRGSGLKFHVSRFTFHVNLKPVTWNLKRGTKGQSTLEYILVVAAILVAVIIAANGLIKPAVNTAMTDSGAIVTGASSKLKTGLGI